MEGARRATSDVTVTVEPRALFGYPCGYATALGTQLQAAVARDDVDVVVLNHA